MSKNQIEKDSKFLLVSYIVASILLIAFVVLILYAIRTLGNSHQELLNDCIGKGYSASYCKSLLN